MKHSLLRIEADLMHRLRQAAKDERRSAVAHAAFILDKALPALPTAPVEPSQSTFVGGTPERHSFSRLPR